MSWPDADFSRRVPVLIDGSATAAGTIDATIALTADDALFWATIQSDGDDIRVYRANGIDAISYELDGFNYTTKVVTIELDDFSHPVTNTMTLVWLVFGYASAANVEDGIVPASAKTGYTLNIGPAPGEVIYSMGSPVGDTVPAQRAQKRSTETAFLWFSAGPLGRRSELYEGRLDGEEPESWSCSATVEAGGAGTVTASTSALRAALGSGGGIFARVTVSGGTTGNDYYVVLRIVTTTGRVIEGSVRLTVLDPT